MHVVCITYMYSVFNCSLGRLDVRAMPSPRGEDGNELLDAEKYAAELRLTSKKRLEYTVNSRSLEALALPDPPPPPEQQLSQVLGPAERYPVDIGLNPAEAQGNRLLHNAVAGQDEQTSQVGHANELLYSRRYVLFFHRVMCTTLVS